MRPLSAETATAEIVNEVGAKCMPISSKFWRWRRSDPLQLFDDCPHRCDQSWEVPAHADKLDRQVHGVQESCAEVGHHADTHKVDGMV